MTQARSKGQRPNGSKNREGPQGQHRGAYRSASTRQPHRNNGQGLALALSVLPRSVRPQSAVSALVQVAQGSAPAKPCPVQAQRATASPPQTLLNGLRPKKSSLAFAECAQPRAPLAKINEPVEHKTKMAQRVLQGAQRQVCYIDPLRHALAVRLDSFSIHCWCCFFVFVSHFLPNFIY